MQIYMIKTEFLRNNHLEFVFGIYHEDMEFAPRMLVKANRVAYVPWISYCYIRRSAQSITTDISKLNKRLSDLGYIAHKHYGLMKEQNSKVAYNAMSYAVYKEIAYFHALCPQKDFKVFRKELGMNKIPCKRIVIMNLNHNHHWKLLLRQMLFLISPYLLKRLGMSI